MQMTGPGYRLVVPFALIVAALGLAACGDDGGVTAPRDETASPTMSVVPETSDPWRELGSRPLELPTIDPGSACPTTATERISEAFGVVSGEGPVYPLLGTGELRLGDGEG